MHVEARLKSLESRYRKALCAASTAKAQLLALRGQPDCRAAAIDDAKLRWLTLNARQREIADLMGDIEDANRDIFV